MHKQILVDTDPGHDDALAIMLLAGAQGVSMKQITTVAGNASIEKTTRNARAILRIIEREDIPVYSGAEKPLQKPQVVANVHGESGLDGIDLEGIEPRLTGDAVDQIVKAIQSSTRESFTLLTLGPLTNIAHALEKDPSLLTQVTETIIMGGAIAVAGNKNRVAEFNICTDPHAADRVFSAPGRKILIPLDLCNDVSIQLEEFLRLPQTKTIKSICSMLEPYIQKIEQYIGVKGALLYDPIAAFYAVSPESFTITPMDIRVETEGKLTSGMTVVERRSVIKHDENIFVATTLNKQAFFKALFQYIAVLP